jgi:hypothetical protein
MCSVTSGFPRTNLYGNVYVKSFPSNGCTCNNIILVGYSATLSVSTQFTRGVVKSSALKRKQAMGLKNVFTLHTPPWASHTYDFVVLTSLTHPRKIVLVVLQIGNRKSQRLISTPTYVIIIMILKSRIFRTCEFNSVCIQWNCCLRLPQGFGYNGESLEELSMETVAGNGSFQIFPV